MSEEPAVKRSYDENCPVSMSKLSKIFELASTCTIDCNSLSKSYCDLCSVIYSKRQYFLLNLCRMLQFGSLNDEEYRSYALCAVKTVTFAREICCRSERDTMNRSSAKRNLDSSECYKKFEYCPLV